MTFYCCKILICNLTWFTLQLDQHVLFIWRINMIFFRSPIVDFIKVGVISALGILGSWRNTKSVLILYRWGELWHYIFKWITTFLRCISRCKNVYPMQICLSLLRSKCSVIIFSGTVPSSNDPRWHNIMCDAAHQKVCFDLLWQNFAWSYIK